MNLFFLAMFSPSCVGGWDHLTIFLFSNDLVIWSLGSPNPCARCIDTRGLLQVHPGPPFPHCDFLAHLAPLVLVLGIRALDHDRLGSNEVHGIQRVVMEIRPEGRHVLDERMLWVPFGGSAGEIRRHLAIAREVVTRGELDGINTATNGIPVLGELDEGTCRGLDAGGQCSHVTLLKWHVFVPGWNVHTIRFLMILFDILLLVLFVKNSQIPEFTFKQVNTIELMKNPRC